MASVLKPFANLLAPGPLQVPTGPLAIDWSRPLANGLILCVVPAAGMNDFVSDLTFTALSGAGAPGIGPEGAGVGSVLGGVWRNVIGNGTPVAQFVNFSALTIYVRGYTFATFNNFSTYCGVEYDTSGNAPFNIASVDTDNSNENRLTWNNGASQATLPLGTQVTGLFSLAGTFVPGPPGLVTAYNNGLQVGGTSDFGSAPINTATSNIGIATFGTGVGSGVVTLACMWNRSLSAADILALHYDPYGFLIPAEYDMATITSVLGASLVFSRQTITIPLLMTVPITVTAHG